MLWPLPFAIIFLLHCFQRCHRSISFSLKGGLGEYKRVFFYGLQLDIYPGTLQVLLKRKTERKIQKRQFPLALLRIPGTSVPKLGTGETLDCCAVPHSKQNLRRWCSSNQQHGAVGKLLYYSVQSTLYMLHLTEYNSRCRAQRYSLFLVLVSLQTIQENGRKIVISKRRELGELRFLFRMLSL